MYILLVRRLAIPLTLVVIGIALANMFIDSNPAPKEGPHLLQAPVFANVAQAGVNASGGSIFQDEAGSAAYCKNSNGIQLSTVAGLYQVIENLQTYETDGYIIGRMNIPELSELWEPRIYIDTSGLAIAFYPQDWRLGSMLRTYEYDGSTFPFVLDWALQYLAARAVIPTGCISYYDFRYPNATHMAIIGEDDSSTFEVQVPNTYQLYGSGVSVRYLNVYLNETLIVSNASEIQNVDIPSAELPTGVLHQFRTSGGGHMALIILYSEE